jgi:DNA-binding NtrC family response regulator
MLLLAATLSLLSAWSARRLARLPDSVQRNVVHVNSERPARSPLRGNIRELRNAIERAMLLTTNEWIEPQDLTTLSRKSAPAQFQLPPDGVSLEEIERQLLTQALERTGGNQTQAAQLLRINRDQVRYRIEKWGLQTT